MAPYHLMAIEAAPRLRVGIDVGGTFTDFVVCRPDGQIGTFKLLSTPNPADAVLAGLQRIRVMSAEADPDNAPDLEIVHGSTVATNALLERKGAATALVTTRGFRDVLAIGRQNRPALYDFAADPLPPLVPEELRFEIDERVDHEGHVLRPLREDELAELLAAVQEAESDQVYAQNGGIGRPVVEPKADESIPAVRCTGAVESIAICLLFSFLRPAHELKIARRFRDAGFFVSASCEVLPEFREYERTVTTVVNAYVSPVLDRYLAGLEEALRGQGMVPHMAQSVPEKAGVRVMQSNGGSISLAQARRAGVHCILSGPAGGLIGAHHIAALSCDRDSPPEARLGGDQAKPGGSKLITFDMGGTSTDVSLIEGAPRITSGAMVGSYPIGIPLLDIHTIGAGGGSIASRDAGGALRVGPQSAGANPGPACYGLGPADRDQPTVTDANLVLGRLAAEHFLGGQMQLHGERAWKALGILGNQLGMSATQAALGVIQVINAHMARALRVISVERGHDPRDFILFSFGGAGGLHASDLARSLGIPRVLIPPMAATLSAFGLLAANVVKDFSQTVMLSGVDPLEAVGAEAEARQVVENLARAGEQALLEEGIERGDVRIERALDMRYRGQSFELMVPMQEDCLAAFQAAHLRAYGYAHVGDTVEIVNARVRATGIVRPPHLARQPMGAADAGPAFSEFRQVQFHEGNLKTPFFHGEALRPGNQIAGPAVILREDTTILANPGDRAFVDAYGNLLLTIGG